MLEENETKSLNYYLEQARLSHTALGHFNFSTEGVLKGIVEASRDAGAPAVMVGTSEGESSFFGLKEAVAVVRAVAEDLNFPVFLNTDHFKTFERCKEAIDVGYDSIHFDGSKLEYSENTRITKQVVDYAKSVNDNISVEGEMGYLRGSSKVQKRVEISKDDYTKPDEAKEFVSKTGIDRLAPVFGNIHGIVTNQEVKLDIEHLNSIISVVPDVYYVLHGASGLKDADISAAIKAGIVNVHFNTELRVAYKEAMHQAFHDKPEETTPYKFLTPAVEEVKKVVTHKIHLFMGR